VDGQRRSQKVAGQDPPTEESFNHAAATDLASVLEMYARPDRRVLERRSRVPRSSPFGPNDRRTGERRSPTVEPSPDSADDPQETASISSIAEASDVTPETS
jgi:hypothetical protein